MDATFHVLELQKSWRGSVTGGYAFASYFLVFATLSRLCVFPAKRLIHVDGCLQAVHAYHLSRFR